MDEIRRTAEAASAGLTTHERVCAERQGEIRRQLDSLSKVVWGVLLATLTGSVGVIGQILMHVITGK